MSTRTSNPVEHGDSSDASTIALVGGQVAVENLVGEIPHDSLGPLDHEVAWAWVQDGLVEHASVAAFARVIRDLLSIGAPAELILATQQAIADELEHACLCFDLASRHAGAVLSPGSLRPLAKPTIFGTVSDSRAGNPVAIALAMLEEGCINESEAAAEAAAEALQCREPQAKSVLERIAEDETRHAALAWRTLRWLLDSHPEVAPALRTRLAQLALPMRSNASGTTGGPGSAGPTLVDMADMIAPLVARLAHPTGAVGVVVTSGPALA